MERMRTTLPRARTEDLLIEEFPDETLVYDMRRDRAHCLNPAAALVWRHCDGRTAVAEVAARVAEQYSLPADDAVVWMALTRLQKARLLDDPVEPPAPRNAYGRREMIRALGLAGGLSLLLPAVESIVAPLAAQAASCITLAACVILPPNSCGGLPICGVPGQCCRRQGQVCLSRNC